MGAADAVCVEHQVIVAAVVGGYPSLAAAALVRPAGDQVISLDGSHQGIQRRRICGRRGKFIAGVLEIAIVERFQIAGRWIPLEGVELLIQIAPAETQRFELRQVGKRLGNIAEKRGR